MALVWVETVICVDIFDSTHAQSKTLSMPQDRNAAGGSLGIWGLTRRSFLHGEREEGSSRVWPWTKTSVMLLDESILSQEWTRVYTMIIAGAWARHQCVILTWEMLSPQVLGWTSMTRLVSLGGHVTLDVGFQSRNKRNEDVPWMCPVVGLWEMKPWPQPWSPASLWDWMDGVQGLDLLGVCGGRHLLFMLTLLNNPLLFTCHTVIWFTTP